MNSIPVVDRALNADLSQGDFTNVSYFANGTNCEVYTAKYEFENQEVIVKMLKKNVRDYPMALREINREYDVLVRLSHPNVVKIYGTGQFPSQKFIVLEYLSGGTLQQLLYPLCKPRPISILQLPSFCNKKKSILPLERSLSMARDIANALKYLHEDFSEDTTIIHRGLLLHK